MKTSELTGLPQTATAGVEIQEQQLGLTPQAPESPAKPEEGKRKRGKGNKPAPASPDAEAQPQKVASKVPESVFSEGTKAQVRFLISEEMDRFSSLILEAKHVTEPKTPLIFSAVRNIMRDLAPLAKTHENQEGGFWFRKLDEVCAIIQPLLVKHGVMAVPEVLEKVEVERAAYAQNGERWVNIFCTVKVRWWLRCALDGSVWPDPVVTMGEGMSEMHFSTAAAQSMAFKQMLWVVFCIPVFGATDPEEIEGTRSQPSTQATSTYSETGSSNNEPTLFETEPEVRQERKPRRRKKDEEPQTTVAGMQALDEAKAPEVDRPLSEGFLKILKSQLNSKQVLEEKLFEHLKVEGWHQITMSMMNPASAYIVGA